MPIKSRYHEDIRIPITKMHESYASNDQIWVDNSSKKPTPREQNRFAWDYFYKFKAFRVLVFGIVLIVLLTTNASNYAFTFVWYALFILALVVVLYLLYAYHRQLNSQSLVYVYRDYILLGHTRIEISQLTNVQINHVMSMVGFASSNVTFRTKDASYTTQITDVKGFKGALSFLGLSTIIREK